MVRAHAFAVALAVAVATADRPGGRTWTFDDDTVGEPPRGFTFAKADGGRSGRRRQVTGWKGRVTGNAWHELRVDAAGDHFEVYWDGKKVVDAHDQTFAEAGTVGLWTKADSVTEFDDLTVVPLGASP